MTKSKNEMRYKRVLSNESAALSGANQSPIKPFEVSPMQSFCTLYS